MPGAGFYVWGVHVLNKELTCFLVGGYCLLIGCSLLLRRMQLLLGCPDPCKGISAAAHKVAFWQEAHAPHTTCMMGMHEQLQLEGMQAKRQHC